MKGNRSSALLLVLTAGLCLPAAARAASCDEMRSVARMDLAGRYPWDNLRDVARRVNAFLTASESAEIQDLHARFLAVPPGPDRISKLIPLQRRARVLTRDATMRAGYPVLSGMDGPYDAQIPTDPQRADAEDTTVELRTLLIRSDPFPHVAFWVDRQDPAHNPWHVVWIEVRPDAAEDLISWLPMNGGGRLTGTVTGFVESHLPAQCQTPSF